MLLSSFALLLVGLTAGAHCPAYSHLYARLLLSLYGFLLSYAHLGALLLYSYPPLILRISSSIKKLLLRLQLSTGQQWPLALVGLTSCSSWLFFYALPFIGSSLPL